MQYINQYLAQVIKIAEAIDPLKIDKMVDVLLEVRKANGRLFFIGVGGGAGNATHAVNDFRKICGFEAYSPIDNVSELTARINDDGWDSVFAAWLEGSRLRQKDAVFIFSVGGGNEERGISANIVQALKYAKEKQAYILGVVGRDGGYTAKTADACLIIPAIDEKTVTPHTEAFQAVIWHLLASHPKLKQNEMKWETQK